MAADLLTASIKPSLFLPNPPWTHNRHVHQTNRLGLTTSIRTGNPRCGQSYFNAAGFASANSHSFRRLHAHRAKIPQQGFRHCQQFLLYPVVISDNAACQISGRARHIGYPSRHHACCAGFRRRHRPAFFQHFSANNFFQGRVVVANDSITQSFANLRTPRLHKLQRRLFRFTLRRKAHEHFTAASQKGYCWVSLRQN